MRRESEARLLIIPPGVIGGGLFAVLELPMMRCWHDGVGRHGVARLVDGGSIVSQLHAQSVALDRLIADHERAHQQGRVNDYAALEERADAISRGIRAAYRGQTK